MRDLAQACSTRIPVGCLMSCYIPRSVLIQHAQTGLHQAPPPFRPPHSVIPTLPGIVLQASARWARCPATRCPCSSAGPSCARCGRCAPSALRRKSPPAAASSSPSSSSCASLPSSPTPSSMWPRPWPASPSGPFPLVGCHCAVGRGDGFGPPQGMPREGPGPDL